MTISQKKINTITWIFIFCLGAFAFTENTESQKTPAVTVETQNGNLVIKAHEARVGDLLKKISSVCRLEVRGLANRENETITFSSGEGSIEYEFKRLLRYLNIPNYTFEYEGTRLKIVSIFPKSGAENHKSPIFSDTPRKIKKKHAKAIKVIGILDGSQAETLDLMEGDLVFSYDGKRISTSEQLIKLVVAKPDWAAVDLIVLRDGKPVNLVVDGGQIGIRIKTVSIPLETFNSDHLPN